MTKISHTHELIPATVFGSPDTKQEVRIEIEHYTIGKWFGERSNYFVNFCRVVDTIEFDPSDLKFDLEVAIAEHFGIRVEEVRIECEIEVKIATPQLA